MIRREEFIERALIYRCRNGERDAFEGLVAKYHAKLKYYVRGLLGRNGNADDVVQEIWLAVYQSIRRLKEAGAFRPWLFRIARNKTFDALRGALQPTVTVSIDEVREPAVGEKTPEFSAEDAACIHAAIQKLSLEHRDVLILRFVQAMSYEEIAAVAGADLGTVKSRIFYAKQALRREMEQTS